MTGSGRGRRDPAGALLEAGLILLVLLAPLPFGSVRPAPRLALETGALVLLLVWCVRAFGHPIARPPRAVSVAAVGLLLLAIVQILPLGAGVVGVLSPRSVEILERSTPDGSALEAETHLLGVDPRSLDRRATLSVDPAASASALRTGVAMAALFLVAATVAATRGVRRIAAALIVSAAFQGLYGLLILASGYDRIWNLPKLYYLNSATGTFVNRNHFACFLSMALACGTALVVHDFRRARADGRARRLADWLGGEGSRNLLLLLLVLVGLAGLMASLSRAGTALGILAVLTAALGPRGTGRARLRLVAALLVLAIAAVPLAQIGLDNLLGRFSRVTDDFTSEQGRGRVWLDTLAMGARYPVAGTGFGTFAVAYPLYRSPSVRLLYTDAHNDLLQLFSEAGIPGLVLGLVLILALMRRVALGIAGSFGTLGVGFAAGVGAFLLHSLVDFNLHIPANAMVFALLAGALSGLPWNEPTSG